MEVEPEAGSQIGTGGVVGTRNFVSDSGSYTVYISLIEALYQCDGRCYNKNGRDPCPRVLRHRHDECNSQLRSLAICWDIFGDNNSLDTMHSIFPESDEGANIHK
jgi:hypothetical protein